MAATRVPSASTIAGLLDDNKSRSFAWAASLIAASTAVHQPDTWAGLIDVMTDKAAAVGYTECTHTKEALCKACAFLRSEFDRQWTAKADHGGHVHHNALDWAEGRDIDVDPASEPFIDNLEAFYHQHNPEWLHTERTVTYSKPVSHAYVGQFDGIAVLDCPTCGGAARCKWLLDFKTGRFSPAEQTLQMAGYRYAQHLTTWTPVEGKKYRCRKDGCTDSTAHSHCGYCGQVEQHRPYARPSYYTERVDEPMPAVAHAGVILLSPDHGGRLVELPANGDAHSTFLRLRDAWGWSRQMERWEKDNPVEPIDHTNDERGEAAA